MTKIRSRIEDIQAEIKETQKDLKLTKKRLVACETSLNSLREELEALIIQSSSSEEEEDIALNIGDHVISITEPHRGRTGELVYVGNYWARARCDKDNKIIFKKAKTNFRIIDENDRNRPKRGRKESDNVKQTQK